MIRKYPMPPSSTEADIKEAVKLAIKGEYPYPFMIVGCTPSLFKTLGGVTTYQLVISPTQEDSVGTIEKDTAKEIIKENGMMRVYSDSEGRIYESPDKPFLGSWEGFNATKKLRRLWPLIEGDDRFPHHGYKSLIWARYVGKNGLEINAPVEVISFLRVIEAEPLSKSGQAYKRFYIGKKLIYKAN